jgi:hypothetical protein
MHATAPPARVAHAWAPLPLYRNRADVDRRAGGFKAGIDQNAATDRRLPD